MELRQLRAFLQVANSRHFGRAAASLNITQPALTQRIQALERELGVQLLTRNAREVRLTAAGEVLLPYANSLIHFEDRALRDLADNAAGSAGSIRIAYLLSGDIGTQGRIVAELRRQYPEVSVRTNVAFSRLNLDQLLAGDLDAAFIGPLPIPNDAAVQSAGRMPLMLALPEGHPLTQEASVLVSSLRGEPVILWPQPWNPELHSSFKQWLAGHIGTAPNIVAEEPPDQALEAVAATGSAVTFVSAWRATSAHMNGIAFRPMVPEPVIQHQVVYRRDNPSPILKHLLRITDEVVSANQANSTPEGDLL